MHPAGASSLVESSPCDGTNAVASGPCSQSEEVISLLVPNGGEVEFMIVARHSKMISNHGKIVRLAIAVKITNPGEFGTLGNDKFRVGEGDHTEGVMQTFRE